jgi:hypothetical protein
MGWKTGKYEKKDKPKVMSRQDFSDEKIGPKFKSDKPKAKPKAKSTVKKLKDTSSDYFSADGMTGEYGSDTGEIGANMGQVNKGGYDPEVGMKKGGMVKSKASSRADGCAKRGKTRGRMC